MLNIEPLSKTFHAETVHEVRALQNVNLTLEQGSFTAIIGTNGSVKSTLLNAIAGTFEPDAGSLFLDNDNITQWPEYKRAYHIGRVFQNPFAGTAPEMTISENIVIAMKRGKHSPFSNAVTHAFREEAADKVKTLKMGLEDRLDNPICTLSGGQRQSLTL